jgi:hypothetical protein
MVRYGEQQEILKENKDHLVMLAKNRDLKENNSPDSTAANSYHDMFSATFGGSRVPAMPSSLVTPRHALASSSVQSHKSRAYRTRLVTMAWYI